MRKGKTEEEEMEEERKQEEFLLFKGGATACVLGMRSEVMHSVKVPRGWARCVCVNINIYLV